VGSGVTRPGSRSRCTARLLPPIPCGMVLGILAVIIEWGGLLTLALAVTAIIFGAAGLNQSRETGSGHGQAVAGVTPGIIGCMLYLVWGVVSLGLFFLI
jgi:hypothetical protein